MVSSHHYHPSRKAEIMFIALMILNNAFILYAMLGTKGLGQPIRVLRPLKLAVSNYVHAALKQSDGMKAVNGQCSQRTIALSDTMPNTYFSVKSTKEFPCMDSEVE